MNYDPGVWAVVFAFVSLGLLDGYLYPAGGALNWVLAGIIAFVGGWLATSMGKK